MKVKLAPLLCALALTLSLTLPAGAYYASNEDGANEPGDPMTSISVTTEPVAEPELPSLGGLTPDGNLALIDDILDGSYYSSEEIGEGGKMQFVTVETKSGNVFYLVIDHSTGDVYFLNLVDESDLLALLEDEGYEAECDCKVKCEAGAVNTDCSVCRTDLKGCKGEEPEPTPTPTPAGARCVFSRSCWRSSSSTISAAWGLSASSRTRPPVSSCCSSRALPRPS